MKVRGRRERVGMWLIQVIREKGVEVLMNLDVVRVKGVKVQR
jgi:hypothetical protein